VIAHQVAELGDVVRAPHERLGDEVHAHLERAREPLAVAVGHGGQAQALGRHVDALARADDAAAYTGEADVAVGHLGDGQLNGSVGQQHAVAVPQVVCEPRVTTGWYVTAAPTQRTTLVYAHLDAEPEPVLLARDDWDHDGREFKGRHDFGCGVGDWRSMIFTPAA
jgi:hypothetical protein